MAQENSNLQHHKRSLRDRVGIGIDGPTTKESIEQIKAAEDAGVPQVWLASGTPYPFDQLTVFSAAATQTNTIRLGTAIIPIYTHHPLIVAEQALTINEIAPGRLRLGIGSSHKALIEDLYGVRLEKPLTYLKEYVTILRSVLTTGQVNYQGSFFRVNYKTLRTTPTPLILPALGEKAFTLAGEISDGVIPWFCPIPYLLEQALPALRKGAESQQRAVPPMIVGMLVALSEDVEAIQKVAWNALEFYTRMPSFINVFTQTGIMVAPDGSGKEKLIQSLIVQGSVSAVEQQIRQLLQIPGIDELHLATLIVKDSLKEHAQLRQIIGNL